ncbi:hypothetical protein H6761_01430 [Candidatus Nomurabacteria bacterium]|nr:hypothetical protein [Candidatus Nomurabacteria bacterium]
MKKRAKNLQKQKIKMADAKKIKDLESLVYNLELELKKTKIVLGELQGKKPKDAVNYSLKAAEYGREDTEEEGLVIEGVFNGQIMIGPDGKQYSVPANYASKSKLVEGDILKLTIDNNGAFVFKQISPVERQRLIGHLVRDKESGNFVVLAGEKIFKVLLASITYFKGEEGDEVVILVPKDEDSEWAAVENVIKNKKNKNYQEEDLEINL